MHTTEFYNPGTNDNPKTGRKSLMRTNGQDYLILQNPFIDAGGHSHTEIRTPEDGIMRRKKEDEDFWTEESLAMLHQEDETASEDVWMDFEPIKTAEEGSRGHRRIHGIRTHGPKHKQRTRAARTKE